jgi:hypothetical protein
VTSRRDDLLYKVAAPREDWTFHPRTFWRTEDWSSSSDEEREDHVQDAVLYAGTFDEVNIHLFPKVWRLRVWLDSEKRNARLRELVYSWADGSRAAIFAQHADRDAIESFEPTVFAFERDGFERTPSNEHVAREPRTATSCETIPFREAVARWSFELIYVDDIKALAETFRSAGVDHQIQT